ncbi:hypothetical protein SDC9_136121 [bioreactor metagenome]|uniref:Uncharacterized protein n=1 Tax=bioreactor metagenome TaxID=1076179 RepID=A0A645DJL6_9ZZZZ
MFPEAPLLPGTVVFDHITSLGEGRDCGSIGRRPADTQLFQFFHKAGLGVPGRLLGEFFHSFDCLWVHLLAGAQCRQSELLLLFGLVVVAGFHVNFEETVKCNPVGRCYEIVVK